MSIKTMDIKDFRELGFLQEVNRQFFHPLGLALSVRIDEQGEVTLGDILDCREDPLGYEYGDGTLSTDKERYVDKLKQSKAELRERNFGTIIQNNAEAWE